MTGIWRHQKTNVFNVDFFIVFIYLVLREREREREGRAKTERENPKQAPAISAEPDAGLDLINREIMT